MSNVVYANWTNVTLVEYDALTIIRREDAEQALNRYWDQLHTDHKVIAGSDATELDVPGRLTDEGRVWLASLHETAVSTLDEHELIRVARDFVCAMGTLLTVNVARQLRNN